MCTTIAQPQVDNSRPPQQLLSVPWPPAPSRFKPQTRPGRAMTSLSFVSVAPLRHRSPFCAAPRVARCAQRSPVRMPRATLSPTTTSTSITALGSNTLLLCHNEISVLIDPWLRDDLVFVHPLFFRSQRTSNAEPSGKVDLIVLTQALPDHAHVPTLKSLPRDIPLIAPPSASALLRHLAFAHIFTLSIGDSVSPLQQAPQFRIHALSGATVGPPWSTPENAYVFSFQPRLGVYHEPHGTFCKSELAQFAGQVSTVICPVNRATVSTPFGAYALVNGTRSAIEACEVARAQSCVLFNNAGERYSGLLPRVLQVEGDVRKFRDAVSNNVNLKHLNVVFAEQVGRKYQL